MTTSPAVVPFRLSVGQEQLDDLHGRLRSARLPEGETVSGSWAQGVPLAYVEDLRTYWLNGYDVRRLERELDAIGQ